MENKDSDSLIVSKENFFSAMSNSFHHVTYLRFFSIVAPDFLHSPVEEAHSMDKARRYLGNLLRCLANMKYTSVVFKQLTFSYK